MSIKSIEQEFIKLYINRNRQERILWEFTNPKKRELVMWRFAGPDIFKRSCLYPIEYKSRDKMEKYLLQLGKTEDVYFIGEGYIGPLLLKKAVEYASSGEICIIYCGNGIGYYQGEQEQGSPPRFLLINEYGCNE